MLFPDDNNTVMRLFAPQDSIYLQQKKKARINCLTEVCRYIFNNTLKFRHHAHYFFLLCQAAKDQKKRYAQPKYCSL